MKLLRIRQVAPGDEHNVLLTLTDGSVVARNLLPLLVGPVFEAIRGDLGRFREVRVEGGTLVWPSGADLCPDVVIWGGPPPDDNSLPPSDASSIAEAVSRSQSPIA